MKLTFSLAAGGASFKVPQLREGGFSIQRGAQLAFVKVFQHVFSSFLRDQRAVVFLELAFGAQ